jgi:hypothetical protein
MPGAAGVECCLAARAAIVTIQILTDTERSMAVATVHGWLIKLMVRPYLCWVVSGLIMA